MTSTARLDTAAVRKTARGQWRQILTRLGMDLPETAKQHGPCCCCGGKDRFRFDDKDGRGTWFCNQCSPQAGDGFALVMNVLGCDFPEALRLVADALGLSPSTHRFYRSAPQPDTLDRRRTGRVHRAFRFTLAALDLRLRAERIIEAGKTLDVASLSDDDLDRAMHAVAKAHNDEARAALFEHVADTLRERDLTERNTRERQTCVA